jgi:hypothetical protein
VSPSLSGIHPRSSAATAIVATLKATNPMLKATNPIGSGLATGRRFTRVTCSRRLESSSRANAWGSGVLLGLIWRGPGGRLL